MGLNRDDLRVLNSLHIGCYVKQCRRTLVLAFRMRDWTECFVCEGRLFLDFCWRAGTDGTSALHDKVRGTSPFFACSSETSPGHAADNYVTLLNFLLAPPVRLIRFETRKNSRVLGGVGFATYCYRVPSKPWTKRTPKQLCCRFTNFLL